jgi:hypothetical protein
VRLNGRNFVVLTGLDRCSARCATRRLANGAAGGYNHPMRPPPGPFYIADLNARGELQLKAEYRYAELEQIPGAAELIGHFSGQLWQAPDEFEGPLPIPGSTLTFRWRSASPSSGIATLRAGGDLTAVSLLASGVSESTDLVTLETFQRHLLRELRDTGFEPAFALVELTERPLSATFNIKSPDAQIDRLVAALADRCFAASYFRYQGLA